VLLSVLNIFHPSVDAPQETFIDPMLEMVMLASTFVTQASEELERTALELSRAASLELCGIIPLELIAAFSALLNAIPELLSTGTAELGLESSSLQATRATTKTKKHNFFIFFPTYDKEKIVFISFRLRPK